MARIGRVVAPGHPHHITQRGNRRQLTFFCQEDYQAYLELMGEWCQKNQVDIWAYCLMPNHVHLIAVPATEDGLARAIGEAHRRYTRRINFREGWRGHLWQGRFASYPMDENYLLTGTRYIELNPVRARLTKNPINYPWSSAAAHVKGKDDALVQVRPLMELTNNWQEFLSESLTQNEIDKLRRHERTGRPLGNDQFVKGLEVILGRALRRGKPGPRKKQQN